MIKSNVIDFFESGIVPRKLTTFFLCLFLLVLVTGGLFPVLSQTDTYAQDCDTVPLNPIANCGFETGDFTGWVTQDLTEPFFALEVGGAGISPGEGLFTSDPPQGIYAALNGFGGDVIGTIRVVQDVVLPPGSTELTFDYRCGWDLEFEDIPSVQKRTFSVNVEESGGGAILQSDLILNPQAGTQALPDNGGNMVGEVDVSAFAGQAVRISFNWFASAFSTGPAFCQLDNVSVEVIPLPVDVPTLSEWGLIAMAGILGIIGFMVMRRRKVTA